MKGEIRRGRRRGDLPDPSPNFWYESHDSPGSTATALRWAIAGAEAFGQEGAETYVLIANATASPGQALVRLYFPNGNTTGRIYTIPPQSRTNVSIAADFPESRAHHLAAVVVESIGTTPVPIAVESATYASALGVVWARGTNALATPLP